MGPTRIQSVYVDEKGQELQLKRAVISANSNGSNQLVAAVTGYKIRVLSLALLAKTGTALNLYFRTGSSGSAIFGDSNATIPVDSTGAAGTPGFVLPYNPAGWMETASGDRLNLTLDAAEYVGGSVQYVEVPA